MKTNELTGATLDWAVAMAEFGYGADSKTNKYSTDWAQGGPIIERHRVEICHLDNGEWRAQLNSKEWGFHCRHYGESPLIAAMRCYVASKLGAEVDLPPELAA